MNLTLPGHELSGSEVRNNTLDLSKFLNFYNSKNYANSLKNSISSSYSIFLNLNRVK